MGDQKKGKVSSRLRLTALCRTHPTSLLPVSPTSFPFPLRHTTTPSRLPPNSLLMSLGKSSAKPRSATRRNPSRSRHEQDSTSSETASARQAMRLRSQRDLRPLSRTERASTSSVSSYSRPRSPDSNARPNNGTTTTTNPTAAIPVSWQHQSGSPSTPDTSQTLPFPAGETLARWPNGSDASPTDEPYSTPRTMDPAT